MISQSIPEKYVEFKAIGILGLLKLGSGYFRITSEPSGTRLEAVVTIGWRIPIIDPFIHLFLDVPALRVHMKSEARNLADAVYVLESEKNIDNGYDRLQHTLGLY